MQTIKVIYFNQNQKVISTHTYIKKETLTIKEIFIPAFYIGAKCFLIMIENSSNMPTKKLHSVGKIFEINFLGYQKL